MKAILPSQGAIRTSVAAAALAATGIASAGVVTGDVIAEYNFDETVGPSFADSTGGLDGTAMANYELNVNGKSNDGSTSAIRFWPSNDGPGYAVVEHQDKFEIEEGFLSFCMMDDNHVRDAGILSKDAKGFGAGGHLSVYIRDSKLLVRLQSGDTSYFMTSTSDVDANTWHHVTIGWGADGMKLYYDDVLEDTNAYTGGLVGNTEPLVLGASSAISATGEFIPLAEYWSGTLDDVVFYEVPEPASAALVFAGAVTVLGRRRRRA